MIPPPSPEYVKLLAAFGPQVSELALLIRNLVLTEAHHPYELIYEVTNAAAIGFTFTGKPRDFYIHIAAYASWVNLGFNRGADIPDPACVLRGDGMYIRHIRISSIADTERHYVRHFIREAIKRANRFIPPPEGPVVPVRPPVKKKRRSS